MSGLAAILAGREAPGVYQWHAAFEPEDVEHAVTAAGRRFGWVDGWRHQNVGEVLSAIGDALEFPDYYGRNLDALNDCLSDLEGPCILLWDGWGTLAREDGRSFRIIVEILSDWSATVTTLLRGEGPEVDLPSLD